MTPFGVFVEFGDSVEGIIHITELTDAEIMHPSDVVEVGQQIEAKVLRIIPEEHKIGMSHKRT